MKALHCASTIHKTEMIHIVQCLMVNIKFLLTIFEEGAGNISIRLQSCIASNKHFVHSMWKSRKLRELHSVISDNSVLLLHCQSRLNIAQHCRCLESPSYSLPARDSLTTWKAQWVCVYLGDWRFSQWHCRGFWSCGMWCWVSAWVVTAILKAVHFFKHSRTSCPVTLPLPCPCLFANRKVMCSNTEASTNIVIVDVSSNSTVFCLHCYDFTFYSMSVTSTFCQAYHSTFFWCGTWPCQSQPVVICVSYSTSVCL